MLACERWTLTHSSGWAAVLVGLALLLGLELGLGLEAMNASSEAETVAEGEVWDDDVADGEDEPVWDGDPVGELDEPVGELDEPVGELDVDVDVDADADAAGELEPEAEPEPEPVGDGDTGVLLGVLVGFVPEDAGDDAGAVGEAELEELEDGEGDGDGDDGLGVGVGVGVDVAAAGSTSHLVSVLAPALVEVLGLAEAASAVIVLARAAPGQAASTPKVREAPATVLSTAARACARRMKTALSPLLVEVTACSSWGS
jgi:hypothetical protein